MLAVIRNCLYAFCALTVTVRFGFLVPAKHTLWGCAEELASAMAAADAAVTLPSPK